jgi:hypothetical protein
VIGEALIDVQPLSVSVHFSHTCRAKADCDLTSTAKYAEEERISGQMDDHGYWARARGVLALAP